MDNNVSKNTILYEFFKLRFTKENNFLSFKYLLVQRILQSLELYQQHSKIELDLEFISTILERKITLFSSSDSKLAAKTKSHSFFSKLPITAIGYSCGICFTLAHRLSKTPKTIAQSLVKLLTLGIENTVSKSNLKLTIEIVEPGWINFYLEPSAVSIWLETQIETARVLPQIPLPQYDLVPTMDSLFPVQYIHARCCCLLSLGATEKLITLTEGNSNFSRWWLIKKPLKISWQDDQQSLWFVRDTEYYLLHQLLAVTDSFADHSCNWLKLAFNLSQAVEVFLADCRFLGKVKRSNPQIAIARLSLIALSQYWLQRILLEKLQVAAPTSL